MSRWIRNPVIAFISALLILWLAFRVVRILLGLSFLAPFVLIVFLVVNRRFRNLARHFLTDLFKGF